MKKLNLLGILAIGGIGYYLLKNKKSKPISSSSAPYTKEITSENKLVEYPVNTYAKINTAPSPITNWSGNNNMPTPIKVDVSSVSTIKPSTTTVKNNSSVKIENALSPLGIANPKALPKLSLIDAVSKTVFDLYPKDGIWKAEPWQLNNPLWDRYGIEKAMNENHSNYIGMGTKFLILNPSKRNKYTAYVDQFGNIIDAGRTANGTAMASALAISQYRIKNNIPF
jgi:hypothetical protein